MNELKPARPELDACPCCGGQAEFGETHPRMGCDDDPAEVVWVYCTKCYLATVNVRVNWDLKFMYEHARIEAAAKWNRRV